MTGERAALVEALGVDLARGGQRGDDPPAQVGIDGQAGQADLGRISVEQFAQHLGVPGLQPRAGERVDEGELVIRTRQVFQQLMRDDMVAAVDRLACTTGTNPVPEAKLRRGYRYERDKFGLAGAIVVPALLDRFLREHAATPSAAPTVAVSIDLPKTEATV